MKLEMVQVSVHFSLLPVALAYNVGGLELLQ